MIEGEGIRIRRAEPEDVPFLAGLVTHDDVEPFLAAVSPRDEEAIREEVERSQREPQELGRVVIEVLEDGDWSRAGAISFEVANRRSRIANPGGLAVHPNFRGRRLADEAARLFQRHLIFDVGFHRLQVEIYAFNERAMAHAERAGFVREGVRRRAYHRHGDWVDGVLYGLVREDLE
jgi:RimJ/RimL family protein N-acetyltransferase